MGGIEQVLLTPLRIIKGESGDVMHALKQPEESFQGFGEAYFSTVHPGAVKGWKKHRMMILNVIVPVGSIKFVLYDGRLGSSSYQSVQEIIISPEYHTIRWKQRIFRYKMTPFLTRDLHEENSYHRRNGICGRPAGQETGA